MLESVIKTDHNEYDPLSVNCLPPCIIPPTHFPSTAKLSRHEICLSQCMGFIKLLNYLIRVLSICGIFSLLTHTCPLFLLLKLLKPQRLREKILILLILKLFEYS